MSNKTFHRARRIRIYPNTEQKKRLENIFGTARFVHNKMLADIQNEYAAFKEGKGVCPDTRPISLTYRVSKLRNNTETPWLKEVPGNHLYETAKNLGKSYKNFLKKTANYPKFKAKKNTESATFITFSKIVDRQIRPNLFLGWIKLSEDFTTDEELTKIVISKDIDNSYYCTVFYTTAVQTESAPGKIGIDLGLTTLATCSNGEVLENPKFFQALHKELARKSKAHSRKKKGSKNREKSRVKLAKVHKKIKNSYSDLLHKFSRKIVDENQVIGLETLRVQNMLKNKSLSKHIKEARWRKLKDMIVYKAAAKVNCTVVLIDPFYPSSNTCSNCDTKRPVKLKLSERIWICGSCDYIHDRDLNASKNIRNKAIEAVQRHTSHASLILT